MKRRLAQAVIAFAAVATIGGGTPAIAFAEEVTADEVSGGGSVEYSADTSSNSGSDTGSSDTGSGSSSSSSSESNSGSSDTSGGSETNSGSGAAETEGTGSGESADTDDEEATTDENKEEGTMVVSRDGETVNTDGSVSDAFSLNEGSVTNVNGDATDIAYAEGGATTNVNGNAGQVLAEGGTVNIKGDGNKKTGDVANGIVLWTNADHKNIIYSNGTISSRDADTAPILIYGYGYDDETLLENNQITAWKIQPNTNGEYVWVYTEDENTINKELSKKVEAQIQYILKDYAKEEYGENQVFAFYDEDGNEVTTGTAGQRIIIKITDPEIKELIKEENEYENKISWRTGKKAEEAGGISILWDDSSRNVKDNGDGTYSFVVLAGGGVLVDSTGGFDPEGTESNGSSGNKGGSSSADSDKSLVSLSSETVTSTDSVQTGDTTNVWVYVALMASAAGVAVVTLKKRGSKA